MSAAPRRGARARFALLKLDGAAFLVPQGAVRAIEAADDVDPRDPPAGGVGWIAVAEGRWPVYSVTAEFVVAPRAVQARRMCALLAADGEPFGLLCDELEVAELDPAAITPLADCMRLEGSPVIGIAPHPGGIACVTSPARLARLMGVPAALKQAA